MEGQRAAGVQGRRVSRVALASLASLVILGASAAPALADRAGAYGDGGGVGVGVGTSGNPGGGTGVSTVSTGGGGGGAAPTCVGDAGPDFDPLSPNAVPRMGAISYTPASPDIAAELERRDPHAGVQGAWYRKDCGGAYNGYVWIPGRGPGGGAAVDPAVLAQEAFRYLPLPKPVVAMTPPPDRVVVNAPLWLSIVRSQWTERRATASVPGLSATVVAVPERVVWDMGDGRRVTCTGPGTPFDPARPYEAQRPDCGHTYVRSSAGQMGRPSDAYRVTATIEWHATWTASGAAGGGELGAVSRTSDPLPVRVNEIQTVVIAANGGRP